MGNIVYQVAPEGKIDRKIWDLQSQITSLTKRNRKLTGALRKNRIEHVELNKSEFLTIDDFDDIHLGDILEITCTKEEFEIGDEEYGWLYTVNKPYKALVTYVHSSYSGYFTVLYLDYANYKNQSYRGDCYELSEEMDFCKSDLEATDIYKIRKIYAADQDDIELYKR
jgi:hypothetical protein